MSELWLPMAYATLIPRPAAGIFQVLLALFFLGFPLYSVWATRNFRRREAALSAPELSAERLADYKQTIGVLWAATALVVGVYLSGGLDAAALGWVPKSSLGAWLTLALALAASGAMVMQTRGYARREELRADAKPDFGAIEMLLPRSRRELRWFYGLSLSAGICEEVLYRGFLVAALTPALGLGGAAAVSTLAFGYAHAYQGGVQGVLRTSVLGGVLMLMTWAAGSIWPAVFLHIVVDMAGGYLGYHALRAPQSGPGDRLSVPA